MSREPRIAVDLEAVNHGRFGKICTVQMASQDQVVIFDVLSKAMSDAVADYMKGHVNQGKVMHDCREDASALFHRWGGVELGPRVFDTQMACMLIQKASSTPGDTGTQ